MQGNSPLTPMRKKKALARKLTKILKQQQHYEDHKDFLPGKLQTIETEHMKPQIVTFFGDIHTEVFSLHVNDSSKYVAAGCDNGDVKIYDIEQGKLLMLGNTSRLSGFPNTGVRWKPNSTRELAACNCDGTIKWYDGQSQTAFSTHEGKNGYLCLDYNCDGSWSAFGTETHDIEVYDSEKRKLIVNYPPGSIDILNPNHMNRIFSLKSIKDEPNLFFTGGWDSTIRVWDVRVPQTSVRKFTGPSITADSLDLKGNTLLVGNYSNKETIQLWDFKQGKVIQTIDIKEKKDSNFYCFAASYDKKSDNDLMAVALSGINKIKILKGKQIVSELVFQAAPLALDFCYMHQKNCIVASGIEGVIYLIKLKKLNGK